MNTPATRPEAGRRRIRNTVIAAVVAGMIGVAALAPAIAAEAGDYDQIVEWAETNGHSGLSPASLSPVARN